MNNLKLTALTISNQVTDVFNSDVKPEIKGIVNDVVVPIVAVICLIAFISTVAKQISNYRSEGRSVTFPPLIVTFVVLCLAITLVVGGTDWLWTMIGW